MKVSMKLIVLCVLTAALMHSSFAGNTTRWGGNVDVVQNTDGSGIASGVLSITYNNIINGVYGDNEPYIGCQAYSDDGIFCISLDADLDYASCSSDSAFLAQSVKMITPDARMSFEWNDSGECTAIRVVHSSRLEDKQR